MTMIFVEAVHEVCQMRFFVEWEVGGDNTKEHNTKELQDPNIVDAE